MSLNESYPYIVGNCTVLTTRGGWYRRYNKRKLLGASLEYFPDTPTSSDQ